MKHGYPPLIIFSALLLSACGWHLQGRESVATELGSVYIEGVEINGVIARTVRTSFLNGGTQVVNNRDEAEFILWIGREKWDIRTASYDFLVRTAEREIIIEAPFEVRTTGGQLIYGPTIVFAERVYEYDVQALTSSAAQQDLIIDELKQNMAHQIVRRVGAIDTAYVTASDGSRTLRTPPSPPSQ